MRTLSYAMLLFPGWIVATRKLRPVKPCFRKVALKTGPITHNEGAPLIVYGWFCEATFHKEEHPL
jgi:hypothetical protein